MNNEDKNSLPLPKTIGRFFWHFVKKQRLAFIFFLLAPTVMVLENNVIPYSLKMIVDALGTHSKGEPVFSLLAPALWVGGGAWVGMLVIVRLQNWWQGYVIPRFQADVRMSVFDYLNKQSYQYFSNEMAGSLANKVNDLPRALDSIFMIITWYGVAAFSSIIVALILMCTINYWFAIVLGGWIVIQLLISYKLSKKVDQYSIENAEDKSELSGKIVDSLSNANAVKLFARRKDELSYVSVSQNKEEKSNKKLTIYMNIFRLYLDIPVTIMLVTMVYLLITFWQRGIITTGEERLGYGARAINEGGWQSLPRLTFPGGALIGDAAGFLNVPKIKGIHTAMQSGMLAAQACFEQLSQEHTTPFELKNYPEKLNQSWLAKELHSVRNIRPGFKYGLIPGLINAAFETYITRGHSPWTLSNHADHTSLIPAEKAKKINYPKPDGILTFDRLSSVFLSNTYHEENQPCHLKLKNPKLAIEVNLTTYASPESRYCPAAVYEIVEDEQGPKLQINAQNCIHCKTCDIKDPRQNIVWCAPEGGGGPNYSGM